MAPCLYPFGKPARASAARAEAEGAGPRDASRGGRVSAPSAPGKHGAGPSSDSTPSASASPPCPFAHLADVWDVDTLRVAPRAEAPEESAGREEVADGPRTEAESAESASIVAAADFLRARLLASGAPLRGDPFSPKAQVRAARADKQRARRVFVHDPLSLDRGDIESSSSDESEEEDADILAAASAARRKKKEERAAARRDARAFESVDRRDRAETHQHVMGLALKALAERFETDVSLTSADARMDAAARRMEDAVGFVLLWCGSAFRVDREHAEKRRTRPSLNPPPMPPLGTHLIRRTALDSDPRTRDLYVQDQCSYLYDHAVRTVDHFVDGERQKIYASAKFAFAPRAEARGAAVAVALDPPAPFKWAKAKAPETHHQSETEGEGTETAEGTETCGDQGSGSDSDSFVFVDPSETDGSANEPPSRAASGGDSSGGDDSKEKKGSSNLPNDPEHTLPPKDELPPWTRQGTFIELGGCSGHPDYLRRVPKPKREPELYEIEKFPALRFERFVKGAPVGRFVGDLVIVCHATNLVAIVRFAPYDAAFAEKTGVRGNVVSGSVRAFRERRAVSTVSTEQKNKKQIDENDFYENERTNGREITQTLRVVLGVTDGDVESCRVVPGRATPDASSSNAPSSNAPSSNAIENVRCLIRGMAPYSNASRGGFDARDALRSPGLMAQKRFWHAVVDAMHARDLGEPLNSVKYELLHPLRRCAALLILGRDEKYIGAEPKAKTKEDEGSASRSTGDDVGRRMRYEGTFLLAGALPKGSPGPLPRFWTPQPTRRMRR